MADFAIGSVLANRYRLESLLGQGGMGSVWRAQHLTLNSPVAIKLIDPRIAATGQGVERFVREARAAAALRSPHVVQTLDYGVHEGIPYIAMELMEGESLADRLNRQGRLSPSDTARFLTHVGRAVGKAHDAGIVHRDLKPDNIFLVRNDDEEIAKVLDFGIAKLTHGDLGPDNAQTQTGAVIGTPYYMSPEQAGGTKIDHRTDIWSMGVIGYQCLLGVLPFQGDALGQIILKICTGPLPVPSQAGPVPPGFDGWFARACARDVNERFSSARQATDAFRLLITRMDSLGYDAGTDPGFVPLAAASVNTGPHQTNEGVTKRAGTQGGASRSLFFGVGAAVLVLGGAGVYALVHSSASAPSSATSSGPPSAATPPQPPATPTTAPEPTAPPAAGPAATTAETEGAKAPEPSINPVDTAEVKAAATAKPPQPPVAKGTKPPRTPPAAKPSKTPVTGTTPTATMPPAQNPNKPTDFGF